MSDAILASILRRIIYGAHERDDYVNFGYEYTKPFLELDVRIELTEEELDAVCAAETAP